ncbi:MAG: hypothetical protein AB8G26_04980 [Ilumatobacter sp.]
MTPGTLLVAVADRQIDLDIVGGGHWTIPVGPVSLDERELDGADRPAPEQLTNALGIVIDHLDDVVRESPMVLAAPDVVIVGRHASVVARVELGVDDVPAGYRLHRPAADEVFRTLVAEPVAERIHNPGLPDDAARTVIGALCCVLAVMRRLELAAVGIADSEH